MVTDRVEGMHAKFKEINQQEAQAVKAEEDLRNSVAELERVTSQSKALATERDAMKEELTKLKTRVSRRNEQLNASKKALRKGMKILDLIEERCYQMGYDDTIRKAHSSGLDHTFLFDPGMADPVVRVDADEPLVDSSGED